MKNEINGYNLSRKFWDYASENEGINPNHCALYFFIIELFNRSKWREVISFDSFSIMSVIGIKSYKTFVKTLNELSDLGLIQIVNKSTNQYTENKIALVNFTRPNTEANTRPNTRPNTKAKNASVKNTEAITEPNTKASNNYINVLKHIKLNTKKIKKESAFDFSFVDEKFKEAFMMWIDYKNERKEIYKSQKSIEIAYKQLLKKSGNDAKTAEEIIEHAITSNYQGFFELKHKAQQQTKQQEEQLQVPNAIQVKHGWLTFTLWNDEAAKRILSFFGTIAKSDQSDYQKQQDKINYLQRFAKDPVNFGITYTSGDGTTNYIQFKHIEQSIELTHLLNEMGSSTGEMYLCTESNYLKKQLIKK